MGKKEIKLIIDDLAYKALQRKAAKSFDSFSGYVRKMLMKDIGYDREEAEFEEKCVGMSVHEKSNAVMDRRMGL